MSKAFLRESDQPELPPPPPSVSPRPPGARNYLTPDGAQKLRAELARLKDIERPPLAAAVDDPDAKRELRALDQRIRSLQQSLLTAEVVEAPATPDEVVRFGATVTVREPGGEEARYRVVGVDEADPAQGAVSCLSPLAQALLNARRGEHVRVQAPSGVQELEIVDFDYRRAS